MRCDAMRHTSIRYVKPASFVTLVALPDLRNCEIVQSACVQKSASSGPVLNVMIRDANHDDLFFTWARHFDLIME